jgi:RNA polymerase sigma-70 factor (sigma-E family)
MSVVPEELPADRREAVTVLYLAHRGTLVRLARVMVDDPAEAEDLVQDAYVGLYRHWRRLRTPDKALGYLRQAVIKGARSRWRHRAVVQRTPFTGPPEVPSAEDSALQYGDPALRRALTSLPYRQRQVMVLRYYLDLSEAETAATLGVSAGAVKTHAHRALTALAQRLGTPT